MILTGYIHTITGDLTPAQIIAPVYAELGDPALLAAHCLEAVAPELAERAREGDVLVVAGEICAGPGAEAAVLALQAAGLSAVVAHRFGDELREPAAIYGLPLIALGLAAADGDHIRIDLERGQLEAAGRRSAFPPLHAAALAPVRRAQLLARMRRVVEDEGYAE